MFPNYNVGSCKLRRRRGQLLQKKVDPPKLRRKRLRRRRAQLLQKKLDPPKPRRRRRHPSRKSS
jgi:hypothetical protein